MPQPMSAAEMVALTKEHSFFSWSAQGSVNPIPMARAEGVYFWDADGRRYLDFNSQVVNVNLGHGNRRVIDAIKAQADELVVAGPGMATRPRAELGRLLAALTPGTLKKFFYTLSGAEANENAVKLARGYTGRHKIITRYRSYHGATLGAITLTGDPRRWASEPGMPGVVRVFDPYKYRSPLYQPGDSDQVFARKCLDQIEEVMMYEGPHTIAAVLIETITGTNGLIVPPDGYLQGLRALCDRYGILLICDEVMAGFGRAGEWFAVNHWNVVPDLMTMAKGLSSSYLPLGAVAITPCAWRRRWPTSRPCKTRTWWATHGAWGSSWPACSTTSRPSILLSAMSARWACSALWSWCATVGPRSHWPPSTARRRRWPSSAHTCASTGSTPPCIGTTCSPVRRCASPRPSCARASRFSTRRWPWPTVRSLPGPRHRPA